MQNAIIYTTSYCPYCTRAKDLLNKLKISYSEINIEHNAALKEEMISKSGGRKTVPQIFIDNKHIGGYDDLAKAYSNIS